MSQPVSRLDLPALGGHLVALACVTVAGLLGYWQYDAWQERRAAEARDLTELAPVPLTDVMGADDPFPGAHVGRPVEVSGAWVPGGTVYIEGREHDGAEGFWVVTPLAVGDSATAPALPVVRGWVDDPADAAPPARERAVLVAWLQPTEGTGEADPDPTDDVLPQVRTADLIQHLDQDLYGAYAIADHERSGAQPGLERMVEADLAALPKSGRFTALRNLLYAIEWAVFGGFAAFVWWRWRRDSRHRREAARESACEASADASGAPGRRGAAPRPPDHPVPS